MPTPSTPPMTAERFLACLEGLGMTQTTLARLTGWHPRSLWLWGRGDARIPDALANWLEHRMRQMHVDPPPQKHAADRPAPKPAREWVEWVPAEWVPIEQEVPPLLPRPPGTEIPDFVVFDRASFAEYLE